MVASSKSVVRWLVVSLLVSTVFAFTAPTPIPHAVRQIPIKPILLASPSVQRMAVDTNGLFGEKRSARRLPSLRRFFRNFVQFATKNKRRRLSSLVFAATVWSRGVVHYQDMPVAHATPAPVERLAPNLHLHGGSTDESATIENAEVEDAVAAKPKPSRAAVNRKLATAGTVLLVPAGYLAIRGEKDDESTCVSTDSSGEDAGALESTGGTDDDTIEEEIPEEEKKTLVRNVLDTAKKARLKVDPDTYLKTLQKEKSVISSAISKLKQKVQSSPPENKSAKAELDAKGKNYALCLHLNGFPNMDACLGCNGRTGIC